MQEAFIDVANIGNLLSGRNLYVNVTFDISPDKGEYEFSLSGAKMSLVMYTRYPRYRSVVEIMALIHKHCSSEVRDNVHSILNMMSAVFANIHIDFWSLRDTLPSVYI